jgi:type VI protein secretion system component VasF
VNIHAADEQLWRNLTVAALAAEFVFAAAAFVMVRRMLRRPLNPVAEQVGSLRKVLTKVRKKQPMTGEELAYARQAIADRRSPLAFAIPAGLFTVGCIYVFGSLEQLHGRDPSNRTIIGLIPMLAATNLTAQLLRIAKLKRRLPKPSA